jgi:hypothetical protein
MVLVSPGQNMMDAIRQIGVSEVTYYRWRPEFGGLKTVIPEVSKVISFSLALSCLSCVPWRARGPQIRIGPRQDEARYSPPNPAFKTTTARRISQFRMGCVSRTQDVKAQEPLTGPCVFQVEPPVPPCHQAVRVPETPPLVPFGRDSRTGTHVMLEIVITLVVGFALGYGVREWAFRQSHRAGQRRRRPF